MTPDLSLAAVIAIVLGPTGAAWVGVRAGLNGTRATLKRVEQTLERVTDRQQHQSEAIISLRHKHDEVERIADTLYRDGCNRLRQHQNLLVRMDEKQQP